MRDKMSKKYHRSVEVWVPVLFTKYSKMLWYWNIRFIKPFIYTFDMQRHNFVSCFNAEKVWVKDSDAALLQCFMHQIYTWTFVMQIKTLVALYRLKPLQNLTRGNMFTVLQAMDRRYTSSQISKLFIYYTFSFLHCDIFSQRDVTSGHVTSGCSLLLPRKW
jgi:hypothetical protein